MEEREELTKKEQENEFLLTRLRLREGLDLGEFERRFGRDVENECGDELRRLCVENLAVWENGWFRLTPRGLLLSNAIIGDLFAD